MRQHIVLLTATIAPRSDQPNLVISNPAERMADYRKALVFYQGLLSRGVIQGVVFAENSGHELNSLQLAFPDPRIEWLSSYDLDYPSTFHRGYGEFRLVDDAMLRSSTVASMPADSVVWKVTGRYVIENFARVIAFAPRHFDLYCASDDRWTEMSLMAWSRTGYAQLLQGVWEQFATGMAPELILPPHLAAKGVNCMIVKKFAWPPLIVGRRGTDGGHFTGWRARWKFRVKLLPRLLRLPFHRFS